MPETIFLFGVGTEKDYDLSMGAKFIQGTLYKKNKYF